MAGIKQRSGGARPGVGPKFKTRKLRLGQEFVGMSAGEPVQVWTVTEIGRDVIVLTKADGATVRLLNGDRTQEAQP